MDKVTKLSGGCLALFFKIQLDSITHCTLIFGNYKLTIILKTTVIMNLQIKVTKLSGGHLVDVLC